MSRLEELNAVNRERALTDAEVEEIWRVVRQERPSQTPEAKRARYQNYKDGVNARRRWRWANDPDWRERKRVNDKAWRARKAKRCSPA